jgi:soluble calcium-activated nucleotidase 1
MHQKWFFLPRRASWERYDGEVDAFKGTNHLIMADEDFKEFDVVRIGTFAHPTHGFSSFQFLPGERI